MDQKDFENLLVWQLGRKYRIDISEVIKSFPSSEKYSLSDQLKRSSRSIGDNIAEGHGRYHYQENIQFCRIARGSLEESFNQLITALDEGYISQSQLVNFRIQKERLTKVINGYIRYLRKKKINQTPS